ncbi:MAG: MaoC/PaaZ C-terminal domain-containing protein [Steroidobacteraceae bacterium]
MSVQQRYSGLPSMVWPYCKVLGSSKPLLAPAGSVPPAILLAANQVTVKPAHLRRYREICGLADDGLLPHAYIHVLAMPLHMRVFTHEDFPVKVLGLVHLRNLIRQHRPIKAGSSLDLSVSYDSLRETDSGQEYDVITRCEVAGQLAWEEVSTMLARRATSGKRPSIERAVRDESRMVHEQHITAAANTGRRYAFVSGDFNPIHLFDRTAQAFQFKQTVAHGMWSLARCVGLAAHTFPAGPVELDAQFKLPIYLPSEFIFRQQRADGGAELSLTTPKGDRLHLMVMARY